MRGDGWAFPLSARSVASRRHPSRTVDGSWETGRRRPRCVCPGSGDEALGNGRARSACGSNATRPWREMHGTLRWGVRLGSSVGKGGAAPDARRRRWCRANAAVNGAPVHPREAQGSRHAAQSSTLRQRLRGTGMNRGSYPPCRWRGVGPRDWGGTALPPPLALEATGRPSARESRRTHGGEAVATRT